MELYACGSNGWGQLDFEAGSLEEPADLEEFRLILEDPQIELLQAGYSCTVVKTERGLRYAGQLDDTASHQFQDPELYAKMCIAGNGKIAQITDTGIIEFVSFAAYKNPQDDCTRFSDIEPIEQLQAGQTHFTALSFNGRVFTWGDPRYGVCLARDASNNVANQGAADRPGLVVDLLDLPSGRITKIKSGGYTTAALTEGQDLYLWGSTAGLSQEPTPVEIEDMNFEDIAVGDDHVLALATDQTTWGRGSWRTKPIGFATPSNEAWEKIHVCLPANRKIVGVFAGPRSSFILVEIVKE